MIIQNLLLFCIAGTGLAFCLFLLHTARRRHRQADMRAQERLRALSSRIDAALHEAEQAPEAAFEDSLRAASLTTGLQRPRLQVMAGLGREAPEKYRILGKLASQGLESEEIASLLGISSTEAGQLLRLSHIAGTGR